MTQPFNAVHETSAALKMEVYLSPQRIIHGDATFSPVSSTLFSGVNDAVLVDAQYYREDVVALGNLIEQSGKRLTTIYITHGHSDHYFGAGEIAARFPGARIKALPSVVEYIQVHHEHEVDTMTKMFGDRVVKATALPEVLVENVVELEGHELRALDIGQGDIAPSTALYSPDLGAIVPGDIVYNGIHMMLGISGPDEWTNWIKSIEAIAALKPRVVIAGHKKLGSSDSEVDKMLGTCRQYILDFVAALEANPSTKSIVQAMQEKYPDFGNLSTLLFSASAASRRVAGRAPPSLGG